MFISFLVVIKIDLKYFYKEKFLTFKKEIIFNELDFLDHKYSHHYAGDDYASLQPHLVADFDIFGKNSLFQYLNRSATVIGRNLFAANLCQSEHNKDVIVSKQEAIKELSIKPDFIEDFRTLGRFKTEMGNEVSNLHSWLSEKSENITTLKILSIVIPTINISLIVLMILGILPVGMLSLPILLSFSVVYFNNKKTNKAHNTLDKSTKTFEKYAKLIQHLENEEFVSPKLVELKNNFTTNQYKASKSLKSLFLLLQSLDMRSNFVFSFFLNTLLLFEIQVYCQLIKWKSTHNTNISKWFASLSEFDSLMNLATFAFNNKGNLVIPTISDNEFEIKAENVGHPLIKEDARVCNSIDFNGKPKVIIITGANMAGKSTFLRTIAVNLILAMNGSAVCATTFKFTPCDIMSSIKIQDSLSNNESYFYAELLRLKEILEHVKTNPNTLVVFDEILRGTNTKDKQMGSIGILEKLISLHAFVIISTHDLIIGDLEQKYPNHVSNFCFEIELSDEKLVFDYKLKKGISK